MIVQLYSMALDRKRTERSPRLRTWVMTLSLVVPFSLGFSERFIHAYLVAFTYLVTLGLGALFFVLLHHLVRARWSLNACSRMERIAAILRWAPILFLPIACNARTIYPWFTAEPVELLRHPAKAIYWSMPFFLGRAALYLAIWWGLATWFRSSTNGMKTPKNGQLRRMSGVAMIVFGFTVVFAAFDWLMGVEREFHSGIYGIYVFAGAVGASLALLATATACGNGAVVAEGSTPLEERHAISKLLFGFVVFWAYIAFCQYLIIWYANIPTEMAFYLLRWSRPWRVTTTLLVMTRFVLPFIVLLSRSTKRNAFDVVSVSTVVLAGHAIDVAWLVVPTLQPSGPTLGIPEVVAALFALAITVMVARSAACVPGLVAEASIGAQLPALRLKQLSRPIPHGAHISRLAAPRIAAPPVSANSGRKSAAFGLGIAALACVGGIATSVTFSSRLHQEVARRHFQSVARVLATKSVDSQGGQLQIPLEVAATLVLADYALPATKSAPQLRAPTAPGHQEVRSTP